MRGRSLGAIVAAFVGSLVLGLGAQQYFPPLNGPFPAGTGTGTYKPAGMLAWSTTYTDAAVQNQWNVLTTTIPANTFITAGDTVQIDVRAQTAANANTKVLDLFFNGATCSGTGASCCATGTSIAAIGTTSSAAATVWTYRISHYTANLLVTSGFTINALTVASAAAGSVAATESGPIDVVLCTRNTSAAAATTSGVPSMALTYFPR